MEINEFIQQTGATLALEKELTRIGRMSNVVSRSWKSLDCQPRWFSTCSWKKVV